MSDEKIRAAVPMVVATVALGMSAAQLRDTADDLHRQAARASGFSGCRELYGLLRMLSTELRRMADRAYDASGPVIHVSR